MASVDEHLRKLRELHLPWFAVNGIKGSAFTHAPDIPIQSYVTAGTIDGPLVSVRYVYRDGSWMDAIFVRAGESGHDPLYALLVRLSSDSEWKYAAAANVLAVGGVTIPENLVHNAVAFPLILSGAIFAGTAIPHVAHAGVAGAVAVPTTGELVAAHMVFTNVAIARAGLFSSVRRANGTPEIVWLLMAHPVSLTERLGRIFLAANVPAFLVSSGINAIVAIDKEGNFLPNGKFFGVRGAIALLRGHNTGKSNRGTQGNGGHHLCRPRLDFVEVALFRAFPLAQHVTARLMREATRGLRWEEPNVASRRAFFSSQIIIFAAAPQLAHLRPYT